MPKSACSRTSTGGTTGVKPSSPSSVERPAHERELEQHEIALEVGEARARDLGRRSPCRSRSPASSRWSRPVAAGLADLAQHGVLVGCVGVGRVGQREQTSSSRLSISASSSPSCLPRGGDLLHGGDGLVRVLAGGAWPCRSPWRPRSAARAASSTSGSSARRRSSSSSASSSRRARLGTPARERGSHRVRVAPDELQVEDVATSPVAEKAGSWRPCPRTSRRTPRPSPRRRRPRCSGA